MPSTSTSTRSAAHASGDDASCPCPSSSASSSSGPSFPALALTRRGNERRCRQIALGNGLLFLCCYSLVSLATAALGGGLATTGTTSKTAGFLRPFPPSSSAAALGPSSPRSSASRRVATPPVYVSYTGTSAGSSPTPTTPVVVQFNHSSVAITVSQKTKNIESSSFPLIYPHNTHLTHPSPLLLSSLSKSTARLLLLPLPPPLPSRRPHPRPS